QGTVYLGEHFKNAGQHLVRDADASVLDTDEHMLAILLGSQPDTTALLGVFGGVIEQVKQDLSESDWVCFQVDRLWRQSDREVVAQFPDQRAAGLHSTTHDHFQLNSLLA